MRQQRKKQGRHEPLKIADWEDNFATDVLKSIRRVAWVTNTYKRSKVLEVTQNAVNMVTSLRVCQNKETDKLAKVCYLPNACLTLTKKVSNSRR